MTAEELIRKRLDERKMSIRSLAIKHGHQYELIRRSVAGTRKFAPEELVDVLTELDITAEDIKRTDGWEYATQQS